jgi:hypothetical protein
MDRAIPGDAVTAAAWEQRVRQWADVGTQLIQATQRWLAEGTGGAGATWRSQGEQVVETWQAWHRLGVVLRDEPQGARVDANGTGAPPISRTRAAALEPRAPRARVAIDFREDDARARRRELLGPGAEADEA